MKRLIPIQYWVIGLIVGILVCIGQFTRAQTPTVNLTTHQSAVSPPGSATLEWHSSLPVSTTNLITGTQTTSATPGVYYAVYNFGGSPTCYSQPAYLRILTNVCPSTIVDLALVVDATSTPASATVTFHSSATASAATELSSSTVTAGSAEATYYVAYKTFSSATNSYCYSNTSPIVVVLTTCTVANCLANVAPVLPALGVNNVCPATTVNLSGITASNTPANTTLAWFSSATASVATKLSSVSAVAGGTYYAAFYDATNNCYGPATAVGATVNDCSSPLPPLPPAPTVCDYSTAPANVSLTIASEPASLSHTYLLVDMANGKIVQVNTGAPVFSGVGSGNYFAIAAYYSDTLKNVAVGKMLIDINVSGGCLKYSSPLALKVCGSCDLTASPASFTFTSIPSSTTGITTTYYLIDEATNKIAKISSMAAFTGVTSGAYAVVALYTSGSSTLVVGDTLYNKIQGNPYCVAVSNSIHYRVCPPVPPILTADINNTNVNTPVSGNVLINDIDPNGGTLTASLLNQPTSGTVTLSPDGNYTYTPPTGFTGTVSFCYSVTNTAGLSASTCVTINVLPAPNPAVNNPPVGNNDATQTTQGVPVNVVVLANDSDPDSNTSGNGQLNNPIIVSQPDNGTAVVNADGSVTYTPPANFTGVVTFPYQVCDKGTSPLCATALVTVTVNPTPPVGTTLAPVAVDDALVTPINTPKTGTLASNDSDPNSPALPLIYTPGTFTTTHGTLVVDNTGSYTYTPANNYIGPDSYTYTVCNTAGKCDQATLSMDIQQPVCVLAAPTVAPGSATICTMGGSLTLIATGVAGAVFSWTGTGLSGNTGAVVLVSGLTTAGNYSYSVTQIINGCVSTPAVTVVVSSSSACTYQPPIATPDIANTNLNTPVSGNVLTNDRDPQGLPLTASLTSQPTNGTVTLSPDGSYTYTPPTGFTGTTSFCYAVSNTAGLSSSACVTVNVLPVPDVLKNNPPVANNDAVETLPGKPVVIAVLANDTDPDNATSLNGQLANPTLLGQPTQGTAVVNGDGTVTYTPPSGFTGVVSFPYSVCDKGTPALCSTAVVTVNVLPTPPAGTTLAPVAVDDAILTSVNTPKAATVAGNDYDLNTPALSLSYTSGQPSHGTVVMSANGSYTYTPATGYVGPDSFTYTVCNTAGLCDKATVSVLIENPVVPQPPIATPDIANTNLNTPVSGNVLTNDRDPQGLPLTASLTSQPINGTVTFSPDGSYTYTPPTGFTGTTSFCYAVSNTAGLSSSACVTVNVLPVPDALKNNPPVANNDAVETLPGKPVVIAVLANDTDPDNGTGLNGQLANPTLPGQPTQGTAVVNGDGTVTYTPPSGFTGVVNFPYSVCDKGTPALCSTAVVSVNVLPTPPAGTTLAPVAVDDAILTNINTSKAATVAGNDYDLNTPALSLSYTSGQPSHGTVVLSANGSYTYTPATGYVGPDSFTYTVCNTAGLCDKATVNVLIENPVVPQPPIATPDIANTNLNTPVSGNVLTNDRDPQGLPLAASLTSQPTNGTVTFSPDGSYTYTPPTGFTGTTSFCYAVSNTAGLSSSACVTVNVLPVPDVLKNNPPVANNDAVETLPGKPVVIAVLANDTDPDNGTGLNGQLANPTLPGQPTQGTAVVNGDGTVTYTPPSGFTGVVSFPYSVCDKGTPALCATAVVSVNVLPTPPAGTTLAPVAVDDAILTNINTSKAATVAGNDYDLNTPALSLNYTSGQPSHGTVVMSANGSYTYTPATGYVGPDSFTYTVCNTAGLCDKATVSVLIENPVVPQPPIATPDIANTNLNTPVSGNVLTNDRDPQGLPLTASLTSQPANGTVTLSPDGSYTYTPPTGFTGTTSFCYAVSNTAGLSSSACVTVNVLPVPDALKNNPPVANNDAVETLPGKPVVIAVLANDTDPDNGTGLNGQLANPTLPGQPTQGTAVVNGDGTVTYTPPSGFTGVVSFPYSVCDKGTPALCATAVVTVNVLPTPPAGTTLAPVAVDDAILTSVNTPKAATVAGNDYDLNTPALSLSYTGGQPSHGTVVLSSNGSYTYTPATGYVGPDSFTYTVCNTAGLCDKATVSVLVQQPVGLKLLPKAWLQGALFNVTDVNGVMRDDLRTKNLIPVTSPYGSLSAITPTSAISNTATVFGVMGNDAIVDWVFVELRSPANMSLVVDSRAALIQRDGDIVDLDGTSAVQFNQASQGNYYVSVRHRNHLGVMTATAIPLSVTGTVVDFRTPATPTYRASTAGINQAQVTVAQGVALWAGNVLYDKTVIYQGTGNDVSAISVQVKGATRPDGSLFNITGSAFYILNGYYTGDVNMDGRTIYQGTGNDVNYIYLNVTRNHPGNIAGQNIFIIREQLP